MSILAGFKFNPLLTPVHRLDPRVKLAMAGFMLVSVSIYDEKNFLTPLIITSILASQGLLCYIAKSSKGWLSTLKGSLMFTILVFFINLFVRSDVFAFKFSLTSLYESLILSYRFLGFVSSFSFFFLTTSPDDVGLVMAKLRIPYSFTFAFTTAIRFVPILAEEVKEVVDAQRSRGLNIEKGGIRKVKNLIPILVPLINSIMRRSVELAEAMEVKCFGASKNRTYIKELKMNKIDYMVLTVAISLFIAVLNVRFMIAFV